jgi:hypothetical protein
MIKPVKALGLVLALILVSFIAPAQSQRRAPVSADDAQKWRADLHYSSVEMRKRHKNLFHSMTREQFDAAVGRLDEPGGIVGSRWSPDGKGLQYLLTRDRTTNIWEQPLAGGQPRQLTRFTSGQIFDFNWSSDHTRLLPTRGTESSDVILLSNLR